ncbi:MAG TPA: hypothetical protein VM326_04920 [Sphingomicrobium sp.]|jgi:hypothetical protein|nr:hypothetical protein [Sphingomicrobium sp.]
MNKWLLAGCALAIGTGAVAADAAVLVVRSSGPSAKAFPAGKAVPETQVINLKANDVVILLDSRGTRTLRGPGKFSATASASTAATSSLAALTGQNANRRSRVGAVRRPPTGATAGRNVWQADVARSGNICVANPADLGLYRANAGAAERVTITDGAGKSAAVQFSEGQKIAAWPADVPVAAGARYTVKGSGETANYTVRWITPVPGGLEGLAQSFIRNDCQAQLDVLIDTFASPTAS